MRGYYVSPSMWYFNKVYCGKRFFKHFCDLFRGDMHVHIAVINRKRNVFAVCWTNAYENDITFFGATGSSASSTNSA